ncbi:SpoIIE family protein phosphatase [Desulfobotulus sp.]|uniref:SpoIIE family protein phosphatase n=1 Tax=Desulfobotulus sp. TaxID=1940337 RepID=UPI002A35B900|nr:SpoIIE family protein phosphatase [Desulfobotulus sp.]MDY0162433.1 SpoIIE family protein phosphatase [Desulfobotulus sp.]
MGIRKRILLLVLFLLIPAGAVGFLVWTGMTHRISQGLGRDLAVRHILWQKERISGAIGRELALCRKLADSAFLRRWALAQRDEGLREEAFGELRSFARLFEWGSWFVAFDDSLDYYYDTHEGERRGREWVKTLDPGKPEDIWFFTAMNLPQPYSFNVDVNHALGVKKLWINTLILDGDKRMGITGTGLDISAFISEFVDSREHGVSAVVMDRRGVVIAHENPALINMNIHSQQEENLITVFSLLEGEEDEKKLREAISVILGRGSVSSLVLEFSMKDGPRIAAIGYLPELDWIILSMVDLASLSGMERLARMLVAPALLFLLFTILLLMMIDRSVVTPIRKLAAAASRMAEGDYHVRLAIRRKDEIGHLTGAFNGMARTVEEHTRTLEARVLERTRSLEEANEKILQGLAYGQTLQRAFLPDEDSLRAELAESFLILRPRDGVGGDFAFVRRYGGRLVLGLGDCTGHGVAGALMSMSAHAILDGLVNEMGPEHPGLLLGEFNRRMQRALHGQQNQGRMDNGLEMALCCLDPEEKGMRFAGARLSLYGVKEGVCTQIRGSRQSLGYRRSDPFFSFEEHSLRLDGTMTFYMSSDGFLDQVGGEKGLSFGNRRFVATLGALSSLPMEMQKKGLEQALEAYQGAGDQRDDITVMGFRPVVSGGNQKGIVLDPGIENFPSSVKE